MHRLTKTAVIMKKLLFFLFVLFISVSGFSQAPASTGLIFKEWTVLGESAKKIDVFYRVLQCDTSNQVHLKIFNESGITQSMTFEVEIRDNQTGNSFKRTITSTTNHLQYLTGECGNTSTAFLQFALPASYNPSGISAIVNFNP